MAAQPVTGLWRDRDFCLFWGGQAVSLTGSSVTRVAELAFVPALVGRDRLLAANSSIEAARSGAELGGPGIAGLIVQAFGAPVAMAVDAASYVVSVFTLGAIRRREPPPQPVPAG